MIRVFQRYLLPGFVFQGIVIGGGYATGREIAEFFLPSGAIGGIYAMAVAAAVWSLVMAVSFELCRRTASYDYRSFFIQLLGRFWILFEVIYLLLLMIVLSVVVSAAGELIFSLSGVAPGYGMLLITGLIVLVAAAGEQSVGRFIVLWSFLLYAVYAILALWCLTRFQPEVAASLRQGTTHPTWLLNGLRYAGYNVAVIPAVFFCLKPMTRRREAVLSGLVAGVLGMMPAALLYFAMLSGYPDIARAPVPSTVLLQRLGAPLFELLFTIVLLGTLVQTGAGLVHSFNERIARARAPAGPGLTPAWRLTIAVAMLGLALVLARGVGLISLVAQGYGYLAYGFIALFVVPVLTVGLAKVLQPARPLGAAG